MVERMLHSGAKWLFRIRSFFGVIFLTFFFGIWSSVFLIGVFQAIGANAVSAFLIVSLIGILIAIALIEVYARLSYKFWKYEFTDSQLRIERGIIWKKYSNIPYQRMQNVDITRGIFARMLGFSTVNIQTAGYSMPTNGVGSMSEGYIPAVSMEEAEHIREFVIKKITKKKGSGL